MKTLTIILVLILWQEAESAHKVQYHKSAKPHRVQNDIYGFLSLITDTNVYIATEYQQPITTARPTTTSRTWAKTTTTTAKAFGAPRDFCLQKRGQFSYGPDCHKYVDCWDGQVYLKECSPKSLVFDPVSRQCKWPNEAAVRGRCLPQEQQISTGRPPQQQHHQTNFSLPFCSDFDHLGYECVEEFRCHRGLVRNISDINIFEYALNGGHESRNSSSSIGSSGSGSRSSSISNAREASSSSSVQQPSGKFAPWLKVCSRSSDICCKNPSRSVSAFDPKTFGSSSSSSSYVSSSAIALCPTGYTGPRSYPPDCAKFTNCWKGHPHVQSCAPGTHFNTELGQCDFPHKAKCQPKSLPPANHAVAHDYNQQTARASTIPDTDAVNIVFPSPPSGQRVRLRGGRGPYAGYVELFHANAWGLVCDSGTWTMEEANLVCRQLGFVRGVRSTTQGLVNGPVNEDRKITEKVDCNGYEKGLEKCIVEYSSLQHQSSKSCKLAEDLVSVTCVPDSFAQCPPGEVPWGQSCYSVHFNRSSFEEARQTCEREGKMLTEITTQEESDLLSELLLQNQLSAGLLSRVWSGGIGTGAGARAPQLHWQGSKTSVGMFNQWWPGWSGERKGRVDLNGTDTKAIMLSRKFDFVSRNKREERLTDYYFWNLEDLRTRLAFVCERRQKDIGCIRGRGEDYRGNANRGSAGDECMPWDSAQLSFVLDEDKIPNLGPLEGNNFCRNPDGDTAPWCIAPNGEFDYCDIPECDQQQPGRSDDATNVIDTMVFGGAKCSSSQFHCGNSECILAAYVCDGHSDCANGRDEDECNRRDLEAFDKRGGGKRLNVPFLERWLDATAKTCAAQCRKAKTFVCRSFNYQAAKRLCTLSEDNVGMTGKLIDDAQWDYYELRNEAQECQLRCPNGKCLKVVELCDGKDDCGGDRFDERKCSALPNLKLKLVGGKTQNEGRVEVKAFDYPFGGICDDGFGIAEANVVCRQLGFPLGAEKALINSHYGNGSGPILLDELKCQGKEASLLDCRFDPWKQTDCTNNEWAGVVCKTALQECQDEQWGCRDGQCIPLEFLCDGRADCSDGSDEVKRDLCEEPVQARLSGGGNNATSGRVEIRYKGVWGTVCDDNFGEEEGAVICRMLGFEGRAVVHSEAAFGPGKGPIWIQNIVCKGNERSLADCKAPAWNPTFQCKHLEDVGLECVPTKGLKRPTTATGTSFSNDIGVRIGPSGAECGKPTVEAAPAVPVKRIAAGLQSQPGAYPWAASIRLQGTQKSFHWCGAVVLSEFHVLTVAHCMEDYPKDVYRVRVGDWDMQVPDLEEQEFGVQTVYYHEEYNVGVYLNNDIALLKIKGNGEGSGRGITFSHRVVPACLPYGNVVYGPHLNCSVSGWGSTGVAQPGFTRYLQAAKIPLLETQQCISPHVYGPNKLGRGMFCAGYLEGGVDTCQGDSGGGMVCDVRGRQAVLGLTSWGYGCGRPNRPGVYTKVADYLEWIEERMLW